MRIQGAYIYVCYTEQITTFAKASNHFSHNEHVAIFVEGMKVKVLLYNEKRFNIRTEDYIRKHYKIDLVLPTVSAITKKKAFELLLDVLKDDIMHEFKNVYTKGIFKERVLEYTEKLNQRRKDMEIERLKKELEKVKGSASNITNITNIIIPEIYKGIKINPLGKEDLSVYKQDDVLALLEPEDKTTHPVNAMRKMVNLIHFDSRFPENHNIHITHSRDRNYNCIVYLDDGWCLNKPLEQIFTTLCETNARFLELVKIDKTLPICKRSDIKSLIISMTQPFEFSQKCRMLEELIQETASTIYTGTKTKIKSDDYLTRINVKHNEIQKSLQN